MNFEDPTLDSQRLTVELLQSEKLGPLSERQREVLRDMQASGKRLQQFIQDFLTYSALENRRPENALTRRATSTSASPMFAACGRLAFRKRMALYFLANDKLPEFPLDSPKLERVISNLLENSSSLFLRADGLVARRTQHVGAPCHRSTCLRRRTPPANQFATQFGEGQRSDTGPGIPAEFHQEVFDDFFRLPSNENQDGMGLGLSIVRRLVQSMGGKVWVESDASSGCKFSFLIPFNPSSNPAGKERIGERNREDSSGG